jgi:hypothetical protein
MNEAEEKQRMDIVLKAVNDLGEHFDSVRVFVSEHRGEEDGTLKLTAGVGNYITQFGQIRLWMLLQEERERVQAMEYEEEDESDG